MPPDVILPPRLRPLNRPRPIKVEAADSGEPLALHLGGRRITVEAVLERWRIDDEWWRERPVSRMYYRVALEDGRTLDLYRGLETGRLSAPPAPEQASLSTGWFRQSY